MKDKVQKLTRQEIYDKIWEKGATATAKSLGIQYQYFKAQINAADIPTPSSAYWTCISMGQSPDKTPLGGDAGRIVELHSLTELQRKRAERNHAETNAEERALSVTGAAVKVETESAAETGEPQEAVRVITPVSVVFEPKEHTKEFEYTYELQPPETEKDYGNVYNIYHRARLYEEVWSRTVRDVASNYKVSDTMIRKICKELNVPVPPAGHWNKVRAGQDVVAVPLPLDGKESTKGKQNPNYVTEFPEESGILPFMKDEDRIKTVEAANAVIILTEKDKAPKIAVSCAKNASNISSDCIKRVSAIIGSLYNALTPLGCDLNERMQFTISGETVPVWFSEAQTKQEHVLTKMENMQLLRYEEERKKHSWVRKPEFVKYDFSYNGRLTLYCGKRYWRDGKLLIEEHLPEIIVALFTEAEYVRQARLEKEEEERKRREEEQRREERRQRLDNEIKNTIRLKNEADDYDIACKIRAYIEGMKKAHPDEDLSKWIEWAIGKADWYDPTMDHDDELLGRRDHGDNAESKDLSRRRLYRW